MGAKVVGSNLIAGLKIFSHKILPKLTGYEFYLTKPKGIKDLSHDKQSEK